MARRGGSRHRLLQAYIVTMDDRSARVRLMDDERAKLTIKISNGSMTRDEFEYDIPVADAKELMSKAIGLVIEKTRYKVDAWRLCLGSRCLRRRA